MNIQIYTTDYESTEDGPFETVKRALVFALENLPINDVPFMIGTDDGILGFVYQDTWYERGWLPGVKTR